jgi:hypothetical protein
VSGVVEERRSAPIGTTSGLALLVGGTAAAAVAGGRHSVFATFLLGLLALVLSHSLYVEIRRQAHRRTPGGWSRHDTVNTILLAIWAETALVATILTGNAAAPVRTVGLALTLAYAASCGYFVTQRRRAIAAFKATQSPKTATKATSPNTASPDSAGPSGASPNAAGPDAASPDASSAETARLAVQSAVQDAPLPATGGRC